MTFTICLLLPLILVLTSSDCDPPLPPKNGYIDIEVDILKQRSQSLSISFVCKNQSMLSEPEVHIISVCDSSRKWVPNPRKFCSGTNNKMYINLICIIIANAIILYFQRTKHWSKCYQYV